MALFPLFVELDGLDILIVGGGQVAKRKALSLAEYGALVRLVAPKFCAELEEDGRFRLTRRDFLESDLEGAALVISATGDRELNRCVSLLCRERGLPVNVVDEPADCSFIFPALLRRGALSAGITTGGTSPTAAAWARDRLDEALPQGMESMLDWLGARRGEIKRRVPDITRRSGLFARLFALCRSLGRAPDEAEFAAFMEAEDER